MDRVYERISIDDVCTYFGYSKTYLSTIFKEQCSSSIIKFFNECKIEEAKRLIRSANMNFSEISDKLSFDNPQYFTRTFKRISGLTPTQFKNSLSISK